MKKKTFKIKHLAIKLIETFFSVHHALLAFTYNTLTISPTIETREGIGASTHEQIFTRAGRPKQHNAKSWADSGATPTYPVGCRLWIP